MNLYEFSQVNNYEMGLLVSREKEQELYGKLCDGADEIVRASDEILVTVSKIEATESIREQSETKRTRKTSRSAPSKPIAGFCIRCKTDLSANPTQPYCKRCYASWKRYENKTYEEKHCHACGKEHKATLLKPLCSACYSKYKDVLEFAVS